MGKPAAVLGSYHVCPKTTGTVPHVGGVAIMGSPDVFIGGMPAIRVGDTFICIGPPDAAAEGSASVFINGKAAVRVGDGTRHSGKVVFGNGTVLIGDRGKMSLAPGSKGSWNPELNTALFPKCDYTVADYVYKTDEHGRVTSVEGELQQLKRDRNTYQQGKAGKENGIKDGLVADEGGHLVASIFNGPGEQINYAAMDGNLNKGAWKRMENEWARALNAEPPKTVKVKINAIYEGDSKRPAAFTVEYWIDGTREGRMFRNKEGS